MNICKEICPIKSGVCNTDECDIINKPTVQGEISDAKEFYYKVVLPMRGAINTYGNKTDEYIKELESENAKLIDDIKRIQIYINDHNYDDGSDLFIDNILNKYNKE